MTWWQAAILATLVPFLILGLLMLRLPRITRRGLFFGVYVGSETVLGEEARAIERSWKRGILATAALTIAVGAGFVIMAPSNLPIRWAQVSFLSALMACFVAFTAGGITCYVRANRAAHRLASPGAPPPGVAVLAPVQRTVVLPFLTLSLSVAVGLFCLGYAWRCYDRLPERWETHHTKTGEPDVWMRRSFATVLLPPLFGLLAPGWLAVWACLLSRAKRAVRLEGGAVSLRAQERFRSVQTRFLCGLALLIAVGFNAGWIRLIDKGLGRSLVPWYAPGALAWVLVAYFLGGLIYVGVRIGQGGAKLEVPVAGAPLTDGLADNTKWKLGQYFNRDDPCMFVEDRFGFGYSANWGNPKAAAFFGGGIALLLALIVGFCLAAFAD